MFDSLNDIGIYISQMKYKILNNDLKNYKYIIINFDNKYTFKNIICTKKLNDKIYEKVYNSGSCFNGLLLVNAIGHEFHYLRNLCIYLKLNKCLCEDVSFIIMNKDRYFLYNNILKPII